MRKAMFFQFIIFYLLSSMFYHAIILQTAFLSIATINLYSNGLDVVYAFSWGGH